ncbi:LptF/LptG family permease [Phenylobacterium sp.]|uniref:LptF/LptG family permease n=1 Tax=Phenylobacterium sp. TaxID=1871053 RepID=UPI0028115E7B|nr:LptF/LptG family permease [Phenylobacterium sp.]
MKLARYLFLLTAGRILAALAVLVGILQILDLLEVTTEILDRQLGAGGVFYYGLLRLPRLVEQAAPLAVLAGSLFAFAKLAGESAVTAMRSTGISAYRVTALALPAAAMLVALQLLIGMVVAPRTDATLAEWWQATAPQEEASEPTDALTFRVGNEIVVGRPSEDARRIDQVTIYRRDASGRLAQRTTADSAVFENGAWRLNAPKFETVQGDGVNSGAAEAMTWTQNIRPADIQALQAGGATISPGEARRALQGGVSVRPKTFYDTQVQRAWAAPFACVVMLLLAAPAALANFRGGASTLIVQCMAGGLLFLVFDGAFTALGENGAAPAILAAWAAPVIFSGLGVTALLYLEG